MMSQTELGLDSSYIVSTNGVQQGNEIVVNVLAADASTVTSMSSVHAHQSHVVPLQVVSNMNNIPPQYLSGGNAVTVANVQHVQTTDPALAQGQQASIECHGTVNVIEVTPICETDPKSNSSTEDDSASKTGGISWPKQAVTKLISLHKEHQQLFDDPHYKKKSIWEMIARKLKVDNVTYAWSQVENKWKSLTKRYRDTLDFNARNNNVIPHTCPFYDELSQAYSYVSPHSHILTSPYAQITTVAAVQTQPKRQLESPGLNDADIASLTKKKKYLNTPAASGSTSSSAQTSTTVPSPSSGVQSVELGSLLRSIHEDRKRQDRLKMDRLEKMHREKMELFKQFLDVVKDAKQKE
ncbi:trihelix transcription factor GT-3a-like [Haliotis rubra]|uniref:trihelix transcription factor GT-3a-like n=1 Tax=Haliotis rubra TaxID=36100 RepID=UPI001EE55766|nr:trihelix transcription factor GT-3a-like [Haliotis rubra]XP_046556179.1 trihelix transcription factor GT-3a-like [Haliotis rubra]